MYGIAMNRDGSIAYRKSFEQMQKEANATETKYEEIKRLQTEIDTIEKVYFRHRTEAQDQYLNECYNQLGSWQGVA